MATTTDGLEYVYEPYAYGDVSYQIEVPTDPTAPLNGEHTIIITDETDPNNTYEVFLPIHVFQVIAGDVERIGTDRGGDPGLRLDGTQRETLENLLAQAEDEDGDWRAAVTLALTMVRDA